MLLYDLEEKISREDQVHIQPIDTLVERVALAMMNKKIKDLDLSAAKFNAGVWYWFHEESRSKKE